MSADNGNDAPPSVEDFLSRHGVGLTAWLRALEPMVPTMLPDGVTRAPENNRQRVVIHTAKQARVAIKTLTRDGQLWVLRLPDDRATR